MEGKVILKLGVLADIREAEMRANVLIQMQ